MLILALAGTLAIAGLVGTLVALVRDGHRRIPTR